LYQDLQNARARDAEYEGELLAGSIQELQVAPLTALEGAATAPLPKIVRNFERVAGGTGFGGGGDKAPKNNKKQKATTQKKEKTNKKAFSEMTAKEKQTLQQVAELQKNGCLRIDNALQKSTAARVKDCILQEIRNAANAVALDPEHTDEINARHGIDQQRTNRCVINLPFRADKIDGFVVDDSAGQSSDIMVEALEELLDPIHGALGPLYAELCGRDAPLCKSSNQDPAG